MCEARSSMRDKPFFLYDICVVLVYAFPSIWSCHKKSAVGDTFDRKWKTRLPLLRRYGIR